MHAHDWDAGCFVNHGFHDGPRRFDEVNSHLFEKIPAARWV